jgi:hypothetical protein
VISVVVVHGIWNHRLNVAPTNAAQRLASDWSAALSGGPFGPLPADLSVTGAYYAHRLRRVGAQAGDENLDQLSPLARELIIHWLDCVEPEDALPQGTLTRNIRQGLARLAARGGLSRPMTERTVAALFGEVARYLDPDTPARILARTEVANVIAAANRHDTTIVLAHSLGSVVTYETLHAYPQLRVDHLITLGSPLALPHAVFQRLLPAPRPHGVRPPNTRRWTNIADVGDVVAVPPRGVRDRFDNVDHDVETAIHVVDFHLAEHYLKTAAVADALRHTIEKATSRS